MNFKAVLTLPKTARSAQTHKSKSFIWIVWSTLYVFVYLCTGCNHNHNSIVLGKVLWTKITFKLAQKWKYFKILYVKKCEKQESKTTYNGFKFILKLQCNTESQADKISSQLFKIAQENFFLSCQVRTFRETHIIWKIFLMVLTNKLIYLVDVKTMRKIFFKLYVLLKKSKL